MKIKTGVSRYGRSGVCNRLQRAGGTKAGGVRNPAHGYAAQSIHEEATVSVVVPFMGCSTTRMFDQNVAKNSFDSIVPDLATSWSWNGDGKQLAFKLRRSVRWHDGNVHGGGRHVRPAAQLHFSRRNPHAAWWSNVEKVTADGERATFHLKTACAAGAARPATRRSIPPCAGRDMRRKPIGTARSSSSSSR
jgi:peptide/nickel transport system substrate-binding protein